MDRPSRQPLSASTLYAILDREFKKRRGATCSECIIPLPFYVEPPDEVSANWSIGTPRNCPFTCHLVIAELLAELWTKYDLRTTEDQRTC